MGKQWKQWQTLFSWTPKSLQMVTAARKLKDAHSLEGKLWPAQWKWKCKLPSRVQLCDPRTIQSMAFSRPGYWSGSLSLLQGIFPTQGSNPGLPHCWRILCQLSYQGSPDQLRQHIKKQRHYFANKGLSSQSYGFSSGHVWMWEFDHRESWVPKNQCFWTVMLEKTLESPLDCNIKPVNPKGNQSWIFIERTDVEAEVPILWLPDAKN